jgi:8-oxo-dGTP diphosphatase
VVTTDAAAPAVVAAGALCWRLVDGKPRILLVHRTQHKDVSLPKGKVDPGETLPETAVREIAEETGLSIALGAPLGQVDYVLPSGRNKVVFYWSAEVDEHALEAARFVPGDEISALEWAPIGKARKKLTYPHDVDIVDTFAERFKAGRARTFAIIALRHAKAVPPDAWDGPDSTRPLLHRGTDQSANIAMGLAAYRPTKLISSTAARCLATVAPLSELVNLPVKQTAVISQEAYEHGRSGVHLVVAKRLARKRTAVLCSHGPVLPEIIEELARLTATPVSESLRQASMLSTGEYTVLHVSTQHPRSGLVAIETHGPTTA